MEEWRKGMGGGTGGKEIRGPYYDRLGRSGTGFVYQKKPTAVASAAVEPLP